MSNPFKVGDRVVYAALHGRDYKPGQLLTVREVLGPNVVCEETYITGLVPVTGLPHGMLRAAIAGQDYHAPQPDANIGHLPDGSSVQKHSAGPLYPCVIAMRDGTLGGKYDYGVISPRNQEPVWLSNHEAAVTLAETIKKDLQ